MKWEILYTKHVDNTWSWKLILTGINELGPVKSKARYSSKQEAEERAKYYKEKFEQTTMKNEDRSKPFDEDNGCYPPKEDTRDGLATPSCSLNDVTITIRGAGGTLDEIRDRIEDELSTQNRRIIIRLQELPWGG